MSKFFEGFIIILAFSVLLVFGISYIASIPQTFRYKITVEIETPEGIKTGSAVREVRISNNLAKYVNPDVRSLTYRVIGEAVSIDLGEHGILFK